VEIRSLRRTVTHQVNYLFRKGHEHKYAYDGETLARILKRATSTPLWISESRRTGTLYLNARKPERFQAA
jgi:hypothetical protein